MNVARLCGRVGFVLAGVCAAAAAPPAVPRLRIKAPALSHPFSEGFPDPSRPGDPVKAAVFERINADRARLGVDPVSWDEAASRLSDVFCARQIIEKTRGHFLMDGVPPYARMSFGGILALNSENSVSWITTGRRFEEPTISLALQGQAGMMAEKPPADGHRTTILDPDATHVGVGYAIANGRFQMSQEFLTRRMGRLTLAQDAGTVLLSGRPLPGYQIRFVTIAREAAPRALSREEATARTSYSYPRPALAYVPEGEHAVRVVGMVTENRIRALPGREFTLSFTPDRPGIYTFELYVGKSAVDHPHPGAAASVWVEKSPGTAD